MVDVKQSTYTPNYGPLFSQGLAAKNARDTAIARVEGAAPEEWKTAAYAAVEWCARNYQTFTVDDVQRRMGDNNPPEGRAMGPVMLRAKQNGLIEPTGTYRPSTQPQCHANPRQVWKAKENQ